MPDSRNRTIVRNNEGYLDYESPRYPAKDNQPLGKPNIQELVELMDQDAENCNRHDFVGVHRRLLEVLQQHASPTSVSKVVRELAAQGGLHTMNCE